MILFISHTTDTPVWWLVGATTGLAITTAVLAGAALAALRALDEARTDRHVEVMTSLASRWNSDLMVRALQAEQSYTSPGLAELVRLARSTPDAKWRSLRAKRALRKMVVLLRVPDYFEDLAWMAKRASLDDEALAVFKGLVVDEWSFWERAVTQLRATGDPFSYTQFEKLAERMKDVPDL